MPVGGSPVDAIERPRGHGAALSTGDLPRVKQEATIPKKPPKSVIKLIADALNRKAQTEARKKAQQPTVGKRIKLRKPDNNNGKK